MATKNSKNWIAGAISKKGALRKSMGVKKGETIPQSKLKSAASKRTKSGGMTKTAKRAQLAMTLKKFNKNK